MPKNSSLPPLGNICSDFSCTFNTGGISFVHSVKWNNQIHWNSTKSCDFRLQNWNCSINLWSLTIFQAKVLESGQCELNPWNPLLRILSNQMAFVRVRSLFKIWISMNEFFSFPFKSFTLYNRRAMNLHTTKDYDWVWINMIWIKKLLFKDFQNRLWSIH